MVTGHHPDTEAALKARALALESECETLKAALELRLKMERTVARVSGMLISSADIPAGELLAELASTVQCGRSYIFRIDWDNGTMNNTDEWCAPGVESVIRQLRNLPLSGYPWWTEMIRAKRNILIGDVASMPRAAAAEQKMLQSQSIRALLAVPVPGDGPPSGFLGFDDVHAAREWNEDDILLLKLVADLLHAAERRLAANQMHVLTEKELHEALSRMLGKEMTLCTNCKRVHTHHGDWIPLETYVQDKAGTRITSDLCPYCKRRMYPHLYSGKPPSSGGRRA